MTDFWCELGNTCSYCYYTKIKLATLGIFEVACLSRTFISFIPNLNFQLYLPFCFILVASLLNYYWYTKSGTISIIYFNMFILIQMNNSRASGLGETTLCKHYTLLWSICWLLGAQVMRTALLGLRNRHLSHEHRPFLEDAFASAGSGFAWSLVVLFLVL